MKAHTLWKQLALAGCLLTSSLAWSYEISAGKVLNDAGQPVQLRGVNWFGFETHNNVVHGLWARNWKDMITQMQGQGFNAVRLPFCPTTLRGNAPNSIDYSRNADLQGLSASEEDVDQATRVDYGEWLQELHSQKEFFAQFGERIPRSLLLWRELLLARLNGLPS